MAATEHSRAAPPDGKKYVPVTGVAFLGSVPWSAPAYSPCSASSASSPRSSPAAPRSALVWRKRYEASRYTAALAVAAIIAGWALGQSPVFLEGLTVQEAAAGRNSLR
jgi:hypothetical protein